MWQRWKPEWNVDPAEAQISIASLWAQLRATFEHLDPTGVLSWGISSTKRHAQSLKKVTSGMMKVLLKLLMLVWCKAYSIERIQITMSKMDPAYKEQLCSSHYWTLLCIYTHLKDPSLQMKAWTRNLCVGEETPLPETDNSTAKSCRARQHLWKMLTDIIPHLSYRAINSLLPWSIFGPFSD